MSKEIKVFAKYNKVNAKKCHRKEGLKNEEIKQEG